MSNVSLPINICDGTKFLKNLWDLLTFLNDKIYISSNTPTPKVGMLWYDISNSKLYVTDGSSWFQVYPSTAGDFKSKVSIDDTIENYLENKLTAGSGISLVVQNPGANENIEITATGLPTAEEVTINDVDNNYNSSEVENALREIGSDFLISIAKSVIVLDSLDNFIRDAAGNIVSSSIYQNVIQ